MCDKKDKEIVAGWVDNDGDAIFAPFEYGDYYTPIDDDYAQVQAEIAEIVLGE